MGTRLRYTPYEDMLIYYGLNKCDNHVLLLEYILKKIFIIVISLCHFDLLLFCRHERMQSYGF